MINAAIFDMDGTFLDSMPYWMNAGKNFLESLQIQAEENLGEKLLDMTLQDGCIYLKEKYSLNLSPEQIEEKIKDILLSAYSEKIQFKEGAMAFLEKLKKKRENKAILIKIYFIVFPFDRVLYIVHIMLARTDIHVIIQQFLQ